MSFEMKYDKDGIPLKNAQAEQPPQPQEVVQEQPVPEPIEQQAEEVEQQPLEAPQSETKNDKNVIKNNKEENLRILRERALKFERERDEALKIAQEMQAKIAAQQGTVNKQLPDEDIIIKEDELVEGKHLNKFERKIKNLEEQVKSYQQRTAEIAVEAQIKAQYPDFDKVVSQENVEALRLTYPELAQTITNSSSDLYSKATSAYTLIKRLGIYTQDNYEQDRAIAQKNAAKPKPLASVNPQQGDTPLSHANAFANGLTDELKEQLRKEMMTARKAF